MIDPANKPSTTTATVTFAVVLPSDATITSARIHADFKRDAFGNQQKQQVNGTQVDAGGFVTIDLTDPATTTVTAALTFQAWGKVYTDVNWHSLSVDVSDIYVSIDYVSGVIPDPVAEGSYSDSIRLPRLVTKDLAEVRRLEPASLSLCLKYNDISTATMRLVDGTWMDATEFVELYHIAGSVGFFRLRQDTQTYRHYAQQEVTLDHAISTLMDGLLPEELTIGSASVDALDVLSQLLTYQPTTRWQMGTCELSQHLTYTFEAGTNLWTAVNAVLDKAAADFMWTYDFTTYPWTLNLVQSPNTVSCEGRLNRGLSTAVVNTDRDDLITRIYPYGKNGITIASVNDGMPYIDADTVEDWGIVCGKYVDNTLTDKQTLMDKARETLEKKKNPPISINVTLHELSGVTGLPYDHFRLGGICRIALPDWAKYYDERIIELNVSDALRNPRKIEATMSTEETSVSGILTALGSSGGLTSAGK